MKFVLRDRDDQAVARKLFEQGGGDISDPYVLDELLRILLAEGQFDETEFEYEEKINPHHKPPLKAELMSKLRARGYGWFSYRPPIPLTDEQEERLE